MRSRSRPSKFVGSHDGRLRQRNDGRVTGLTHPVPGCSQAVLMAAPATAPASLSTSTAAYARSESVVREETEEAGLQDVLGLRIRVKAREGDLSRLLESRSQGFSKQVDLDVRRQELHRGVLRAEEEVASWL